MMHIKRNNKTIISDSQMLKSPVSQREEKRTHFFNRGSLHLLWYLSNITNISVFYPQFTLDIMN